MQEITLVSLKHPDQIATIERDDWVGFVVLVDFVQGPYWVDSQPSDVRDAVVDAASAQRIASWLSFVLNSEGWSSYLQLAATISDQLPITKHEALLLVQFFQTCGGFRVDVRERT